MKALTFLKIFTIVNLLTAMGFSVAGMVNPFLILPANINADKAVMVFALYAGARAFTLTVVVICFVFKKQWNALITLAFWAGVMQVLDGFIGVYQHDVSKSAGPFVIATVEFIAIYYTLKSNNNTVAA